MPFCPSCGGWEPATSTHCSACLTPMPGASPGDTAPGPSTEVWTCGYCFAHEKSPNDFLVTTVPGAVSEHWCGMKVRWTGTRTSPMQVVHDPGNARAYVFLTVLALPTVLALLVGGIT